MMETQLSPEGKIWTRWHQERFLNNTHEKPLANAPNKRYIAIIKEIIKHLASGDASELSDSSGHESSQDFIQNCCYL